MSRDLSALAALFAKEYRSSNTNTSETAKEQIKWKILRWACDLSSFQNVSEMMNNIQEALERAPAVVLELQQKDVILGRRSIPYRQRVFMFVEEYRDAVGWKAKREVLEKIVMKLGGEGFRFLMERETGEEGWMVMEFSSTCKKVQKLLLHFLNRKVSTPLSPLDAPPGPFVPPDKGPPTNAILSGSSVKEAFGHPANVVYRKRISDVAPEYKIASKEKKNELTKQTVDVLRKEGFRFVVKDLQGAWRELELSRVLDKVRRSLRDCERDYKRTRVRKRKAVGELTLPSPEEEVGQASNTEETEECDVGVHCSFDAQECASTTVDSGSSAMCQRVGTMEEALVPISPNASDQEDTIRAARPASQDIGQKLVTIDSADVRGASYVEDIAWRELSMDDPSVDKLPVLLPPGPLPPLLTDEQSCTWSFDEENRILRATLKPGVEALSRKAKEYLLLMMERDDIAVVTGGLCRGLETSLWNLHCITSTSGEMYHHNFRRFVRMDAGDLTDSEMRQRSEYEEINEHMSMKVVDYFRYLEERRKLIESNGVKQGAERRMSYVDFVHEETTLDLDEVIYMLDYDIKSKLPLHYQNFKDNFSFPEILPGGNMCTTKAVNEAARPEMGPNLYVTPPGSFTRFHQDGYGTVDSGHLCLSGYNEVVMLRRLPKGHDVNAIHADGKGFYEMPHDEALGKKTSDWPTKAEITRMKSLNYCPTVLILRPGDHLHIGKGRFHAFRKLGAEMLADDDCHSDLRKEVHSTSRMDKSAFATLVNVSVAWDWSFLGWTPEGINREMAATLECALRNRKFRKLNLAIPKLCLLSYCKSSIAAIRSEGSVFGMDSTNNNGLQQQHRNILKGLLPTLEFVVSQELDAFRASGSSIHSWNQVRPHSWENPAVFLIDPHGNSDYFCMMCYQELANSYMHCQGCEILLKKDFNVCVDCHSGSQHGINFTLNDKGDAVLDSSLNHTGAFSASRHKNCAVKGKEKCLGCGRGPKCCCTCHLKFEFQHRMWNRETLSIMLADARDIVAGDKLPFFQEVMPRLREASRDNAPSTPQ